MSGRRKAVPDLSGFLEAAPDALVVVEDDGEIALVNSQTERLFGWGRADLVGHSISILIPERFRARHANHVRGYARDPRVRGMGSGLELYGLRKDGSEFPVEISLSPFRTDEGLLIAAAIRDISARKAIESALKIANRELESFSYSVAHDLRAPLRGISGFAQILADDHGASLDADALECLREIQENAARMGGLIDALLSLSRVTRSDLRPEWVDLSEMARGIGVQLATAEPECRVRLSVREGIVAFVDPDLGRTLLTNLLSNAWKFTGRASEPRVEVDTDPDGTIHVRDNGAGFDPAYGDKLFVPFQRLHTVGEFAGTGIGLATAQRIVHRHGGRIWAEGAVDRGATFHFQLPVPPYASPDE